MINLAVIDAKDLIKYLVKITIIISIVVLITRYFSDMKSLVINKTRNKSFVQSLSTVIPSMNLTNKNQEFSVEEAFLAMLDAELKVASNVKQEDLEHIVEENDEIIQNEIIEDVNQNIVNNEEISIDNIPTNVETKIIDSGVAISYTNQYNGVYIRNESDKKLTQEIMEPNIDFNKDSILIYHTHACESYTQTEEMKYKPSGNFRTLDITRSVVEVGTVLKGYLEDIGIDVTHDQTLYDYPSYNESYSRSLAFTSDWIKDNRETEILFDIHRDALGDTTYAPTVRIGDEEVAQLMFVIGTNGGGNTHDNWEKNLQYAIKIQEKANEMYPGLFKPIIVRNSRYNQHVAVGTSIIEVGATGNTLEQAQASMKYLAKVISEI